LCAGNPAASILVQLLTPALSSFGEEREKYFAGRIPRVFAALKPWAAMGIVK